MIAFKFSLRPALAKHTSQHADEMIFHIGELAGGLPAHAIEHQQGVRKVAVSRHCVDAAEYTVAEAFIACAGANERIGNRAVRIVDDGDGLGRRCGLDIRR